MTFAIRRQCESTRYKNIRELFFYMQIQCKYHVSRGDSSKIYRGTRVVGVRAGYSREHTLGMLRETQKRRLPPFAIICSDAFTCLAERSEAEAGGPCRERTCVCTRLGVARGSKTKRMYSESRRFLIVHKGRVDCPDNRDTDARLVYT